MTRLRLVAFAMLAKVAEEKGFHRTRQEGSHIVFRNDGGKIVVIPNHGSQVIVRPLAALKNPEGYGRQPR
ncbi:MAG: type II toxin-antitoxin system HicA family toxin [Anaerolineales bacterium]|nr:type II toxin-antitoxin system HicA family toxin [Anaerolineales bacterium]